MQNVTDPDVLQILHQIACDLAEIKALVQPKAKKPAQPKKAELSDSEWLQSLCASAAYRGVNVMREYEKMKVWCSENKAVPTRKRFINWLNRADRSMDVQVKIQPPAPPVYYKKVEPAPKQGEAPPPEVAKALSRLLGKDFSFGGKA